MQGSSARYLIIDQHLAILNYTSFLRLVDKESFLPAYLTSRVFFGSSKSDMIRSTKALNKTARCSCVKHVLKYLEKSIKKSK